MLNKEWSEYEKLCNYISSLTNIQCGLLQGSAFCFSTCEQSHYCAQCSCEKCSQLKPHLLARAQARQCYGKYIYSCPAGFAFFVITIQDDLAAVFGPAVLTNGESEEATEQIHGTSDVIAMTFLQFGQLCEIARSIFGNFSAIDTRQKHCSKRTTEILDYIQAHFSERITIEQLCALTDTSRSYLSKCFRNETGMSIVDYINQYRVCASARLLRETSQSVVDIAFSCGFDNQSYYNRIFRRFTGITPNQYRRGKKTTRDLFF